MNSDRSERQDEWRSRIHTIIFGHDTGPGKTFDVALFFAISVSVLIVMLESVSDIKARFGELLIWLEWGFTLLFTGEYLLRLYSAKKPLAYSTSFFGVVDLLSIAPTYLSLFIPGSQTLVTIRALRLLRVFRVLKLGEYLKEADDLGLALRASTRKIIVFLGAVLTLTIIMGSLMYFIEGEKNGFTSVPRSVYWAIVTLTTVGYGDIAPQTVLGQIVAALVMILGYGILAVPTGIVSAQLVQEKTAPLACSTCHAGGHDRNADYCKYCGNALRLGEQYNDNT